MQDDRAGDDADRSARPAAPPKRRQRPAFRADIDAIQQHRLQDPGIGPAAQGLGREIRGVTVGVRSERGDQVLVAEQLLVGRHELDPHLNAIAPEGPVADLRGGEAENRVVAFHADQQVFAGQLGEPPQFKPHAGRAQVDRKALGAHHRVGCEVGVDRDRHRRSRQGIPRASRARAPRIAGSGPVSGRAAAAGQAAS